MVKADLDTAAMRELESCARRVVDYFSNGQHAPFLSSELQLRDTARYALELLEAERQLFASAASDPRRI